MRKKQCAGACLKFSLLLLLAVSLSLCGCADPGVSDHTQLYTQTQTSIAPEETTQMLTESTEITESTEPAKPEHSDFYLPDYTTLQIQEYFSEVALDMEYTFGDGDATLVVKWIEPIYYRIYGEATEEDRAVLNSLLVQLNEIPGFPGIYAADEENQENLSISFLNQQVFNESFSDVVGGEYATGAAQFWYYNETSEIYTGRIGCSTDIDQSVRNSVLQEEIVNVLGISDTVLREDSIVYQYSDENVALSDVDLIILKLLYNPAIQCGMNRETCFAILEELYY